MSPNGDLVKISWKLDNLDFRPLIGQGQILKRPPHNVWLTNQKTQVIFESRGPNYRYVWMHFLIGSLWRKLALSNIDEMNRRRRSFYMPSGKFLNWRDMVTDPSELEEDDDDQDDQDFGKFNHVIYRGSWLKLGLLKYESFVVGFSNVCWGYWWVQYVNWYFFLIGWQKIMLTPTEDSYSIRPSFGELPL